MKTEVSTLQEFETSVCRADIVTTRENPLDNISTLKKVVFVMKTGKVFKKAD